MCKLQVAFETATKLLLLWFNNNLDALLSLKWEVDEQNFLFQDNRSLRVKEIIKTFIIFRPIFNNFLMFKFISTVKGQRWEWAK